MGWGVVWSQGKGNTVPGDGVGVIWSQGEECNREYCSRKVEEREGCNVFMALQ